MYKPKPIQKFESTLQKVVDVSDVDKIFYFEVSDTFDFTPGQFVTILFEHEGKPIRRPYSIFSSPFEVAKTQLIELLVKKVDGGPGTTMLWNLSIGDKVTMMGPMGVFVLKEEFCDGPLTFIGTGTGVAPFRSMIGELLKNGYEHPIILIAGYRYVKRRLYHSEFAELAKKHANFTYHVTISQAESEHDHFDGRVTHFLNEHNGTQGRFFLCGLYAMIKEVVAQLQEKNIDRTKIHFERYD